MLQRNHGGRGNPRRAIAAYIGDLVLELQKLASKFGFDRLATLLNSAYIETRRLLKANASRSDDRL